MSLDLPNALLGGAVGLILAGIAGLFRQRVIGGLRRIRTRQLLDAKRFGRATSQLTWAYARWLRADPHLVLRGGFLSRRCWNRDVNSITSNVEISFSNTLVDFPVKLKLINSRIRLGQCLSNNDAYFCSSISDCCGRLKINLAIAKYYAIVTNVDSIERSSIVTARRANSSRFSRSGSVQSFSSLAFRPTLVGCSFVPVFIADDGSIEILLHRRSPATFTYGGMLTGLPNFGLAPMPLIHSLEIDRNETVDFWNSQNMTVLKYNFFKEYLEELRGYRELEDDRPLDVVNFDWLISDPEIADLQQKMISGVFKFEYLGFGFDALTLGGVIRYAWTINGDDQKETFFKSLKTNWEIDTNGISPTLKIFSLHSAELKSELFMNKVHSAAAATILDLIDMYPSNF